jgi:hypothetical protein
MAGWSPVRRTPREHLSTPLRGYKLAHPMISADGSRAGFSGVTLGRASVYGVQADAECAQGGRHRSPSRWCDCGFYCVHTLDDARALACDPDYRYAVLLEVAVSGRFLRYERGLRYARQRVTRVRVGRCGCGHAATVFVETGAGSVGWRRLVAVCAACANPRPGLSLADFAKLLGGTPVAEDETSRPYDPVRPFDLGGSSPTPEQRPEPAAQVPDGADPEAMVPLLTAEVALLQARLDEVQRQLDRLTQR